MFSTGVNFPPRSITNVDLEYYSLTIETNLKGTFAFCKHFVASAKRDEEEQTVDRPVGGYSIVSVATFLSRRGVSLTFPRQEHWFERELTRDREHGNLCLSLFHRPVFGTAD